VSDPRRSSKDSPRGSVSRGAPTGPVGPTTSVARTGLSALLVAAGIAWIVVYLTVAADGSGLAWMGGITRWNFLIGFGLLFLGLAAAANRATPLGRGRGVVVGMLGCFLLGLVWIITYYMAGSSDAIPVIYELQQYNLVVGIGFMAVGFVYATRWE
jgi:hypothetical protein